MVEIVPGLLQGRLDFLLGRLFPVQVDKSPQNGWPAIHMFSGSDMLNHQLRIQPVQKVLEGVELVFIPDRECLGQVDFGLHIVAPNSVFQGSGYPSE